jgi:hypothetical protein
MTARPIQDLTQSGRRPSQQRTAVVPAGDDSG